MNAEVRYGDVALGVESALPIALRPWRRRGRVQAFTDWLKSALRRWA